MMKLMIGTLMLSSAIAFAPATVTHALLQGESVVKDHGPMILNNSGKRLSRTDFRLHVATTDKDSNFIATMDDSNTDYNVLAKVTQGYQELTSKHYLTMAFLQAGVLASGADIATQSMEAAFIDYGHVAAMATVASTMSGVMNAIWLRQLENAFPGTESKEVACKTMIHATIFATIINSAYLAFVPLFTTYLYHDGGTLDLSVLFSSWSVDEFITLTKLELLMFIPYNTLAFKFVPPSVRPLTHAAISATFNVAVSAVTLGYFDKWCESATGMFS
jgi:hypothetical protein